MKIAIVGTGYVGLVSGVCLAAKGHEVTGVDVNPEVVRLLNRGEPHVHERNLEALLRSAIGERRFRATTDLAAALTEADAAIIAVGTPSLEGVIDLTGVRTVAREVGAFLARSDRFQAIIVKSTVIPGTTDTIVNREIAAASGKTLGQYGLGMNPEFLREGQAVDDFMQPDRIVMGHDDTRTLTLMRELYAPWICDKLAVNSRTAEFIKYANNVLLAAQISLANELANLAAALGKLDIMDVVEGVQLDRRWNPIVERGRVSPEILSYLVPGCGFGGSCFPKDLQALRAQGRALGLPMRMLNAVLEVNEAQPLQVVETLGREVGNLNGRRCLLLGLAFKPDTDDVRESASLKIAGALLDRGARVIAHDPIAAANFRRAMGAAGVEIDYVSDWRPALAHSEIVVVATKWPEYRELESLAHDGRVIFDARRLLDPRALRGARYLSIGRRLE